MRLSGAASELFSVPAGMPNFTLLDNRLVGHPRKYTRCLRIVTHSPVTLEYLCTPVPTLTQPRNRNLYPLPPPFALASLRYSNHRG